MKSWTQLAQRGDVLGIVNNVALQNTSASEASIRAHSLDIMKVNTQAALQLTQALVPTMRNPRFGRIINITSLVTRGLPFRSSYAAAKSALESLTRTMAIELAPDGIMANAIAPGPTETELSRAHSSPGSEGEKRYLANVPMGPFAQPQEIASVVAFLASDSAGFITGQTLFVDGGSSLGRL